MTPDKVSPLAPAAFPEMPAIAGVRVAACAAGVRYQGRTDLLLVELAEGTAAAGVLTRSKTASAPVDWCRRALVGGEARAVLVNSGNANAFTGRKGEDAVERIVEAVAETVPCRPSRVFCASTGVIGEPLPWQTVVDAVPGLHAEVRDGDWEAAARAIMTTDTFPKGAVRTARIGDAEITIAGIAKGSGMIQPDMATMLAFVFTDAQLPAAVLQTILKETADRTFNSITVDSDTSTSDTVLAFATGAGPAHPAFAEADAPELAGFRAGFEELMRDLAHQVVRDGEGASKFVAITVAGAESDVAARRIGLAIANSPLVKTAIAGEDANWGRIVMAVGKAGEAADRDRLAIDIGGIAVARDGLRVEDYDEAPVAEHMRGQEIEIFVDVGVREGDDAGRATVWTCDLTHGYIDINADYRS